MAVLVLFIIIIFSVLWFYKSRKNKNYYDNMRGPPALPIFGNLFEFTSTSDILDVFTKYAKEFGGIYKIHLGPFCKDIIISDYKLLEFVLSSSKVLSKSDGYRYFHPWLGTGLLTSDGQKWKKHRRILTPSFHFQILEQFIDVFESAGDKLIKKLEVEVGKKSTDIYPFITLCTLDIICESAMGTSVNAQDDSNSDYVQSVKTMCRIVMDRSFSALEGSDLTFPFTKNYLAQKKALSILHRHTNDVIIKRREKLNSRLNEDIEQDNNLIKKKKAFLDLLLEATVDGRVLTQEEIREEVDTFMFEGHDTTASAISFTLFCLANHTDVQKKAYEEQVALFGNNEDPTPTYADLQSMKYLDHVIKETLRLYPSVPIYSRQTTESLEYNGITIPKGITLNIFAYGIHRNSEYFEEPDNFNPSRFENIDGKLPYAYIPFSAGPRNCIGQRFAMLEMKSTISKIIRKFELQPASPYHKLKLASEAVLKSANGIKIALKMRT